MTAAIGTASKTSAKELTLTVADRVHKADQVVCLRLRAADGAPLPPWEPGAHVEIALSANDQHYRRHYSLCGDPTDVGNYRIAVLECPDGRGGSRAVHQVMQPGTRVQVSLPRNHFAFRPNSDYPVVFVAGGIGITPLLPMVNDARRRGLSWRALYLGRNAASMAFVDDLTACADRPGQVIVHHSDESGVLDLVAAMEGLSIGTQVYACGPEPLLDALTEMQGTSGAQWSLQLERFAVPDTKAAANDTAFEVVLGSTGQSFSVRPGCSILSVLRDNGIDADFSCAEGVCGTCETAVLEGVPDHRDVILDDDERASGDTMMICVSRAVSERLVLDL